MLETNDVLLARMRDIKSQIKNIEKELPYADHGDYGQLRTKISQLQTEYQRLWKRTQET